MENKLQWRFPTKDFVLLRIELLFLAMIAVLIFIFTYFATEYNWFAALIFTVIFIGLYLLISSLVQKVSHSKEHYHITPQHLEITKVGPRKTSKLKIHLKDIKRHKLDKTFLGGYLLTHKKKKHLLFFNTKKEADQLDKFLKKHKK